MPMLATILVVSIAMAASAFKGSTKAESQKASKSAPPDIIYFQYDGPTESDANLRNSAYWTELSGLPGSSPCPSGSIVCVSHLDDATLQQQSGADNKAKFMDYLTNAVDASDYVQANSDYEKP